MSGRASHHKKDRRDLPDRRLPQTPSRNSYVPEVSSRLQQSWVPSSNTSNRSASPYDSFGNEYTPNSQTSTNSRPGQSTRAQGHLHLRGYESPNSSPAGPSQPHTPLHLRGSHPGFNPQAVEFSPSPPRSAYAQPASYDNSPEAQRANRLSHINQMEDFRDREEAMNDFIFDQATPCTREDLAREKEELELQRRKEQFEKYRKSKRDE
ncbi:Ff.00g067800.m01.CDS01 [Fusarium sp. VM40]|nr:Ff.00g067800.m01.CDS01 [Fusarium sp. VM40]